jgi:hypothetical protein
MIWARVRVLITALALLFATLTQADYQTRHPQDKQLALTSELSSHKCDIHVIGLASGSAYRLTISLRFGGSIIRQEVELNRIGAGNSSRCPFNIQWSLTCDISMAEEPVYTREPEIMPWWYLSLYFPTMIYRPTAKTLTSNSCVHACQLLCVSLHCYVEPFIMLLQARRISGTSSRQWRSSAHRHGLRHASGSE